MSSTLHLRPRRALVHPLWVGALVVLALNDHWWKGADLLPAAVTGKISDFAGLLVAPVLLAAVLGIRRGRGLLVAHVAVGLVFTMIQLSRPFADLWSALMGMFGVPWVITCDPTDLVALPTLWLSMLVFPRAMQRSTAHGLRRTGEVSGAVVGLFCCVATSAPQPDPFAVGIEADVYVHNGTDEDLVVRIRRLAPEVLLDCDAVASDPGRLLSAPLFGTAQSWTVVADTNVALRDDELETSPCYAVLLDADGWPARVVFWRYNNPPWSIVPGEGLDRETVAGWISMGHDDEGDGIYEAADDLLFTPVDDAGPDTGACAIQDDGDRNEWSEDVPHGHWSIVAIEPGLDGCTGFGLGSVGSDVESMRWYVCTPQLELPFTAGDAIAIDPFADPTSAGMTMRAIDPETFASVVPTRAFVVSRGGSVPRIEDLDTTFVPSFDCPATVDACGTVATAGELVVGGPGWPSTTIPAGASVDIEQNGGARIEIALAHGQDRSVVNPECALGPEGLGYDIEIAATYVGPAQ